MHDVTGCTNRAAPVSRRTHSQQWDVVITQTHKALRQIQERQVSNTTCSLIPVPGTWYHTYLVLLLYRVKGCSKRNTTGDTSTIQVSSQGSKKATASIFSVFGRATGVEHTQSTSTTVNFTKGKNIYTRI